MSSVCVDATCPWCGKEVTDKGDPITFQSCNISTSCLDSETRWIIRKRGLPYENIGGENPKSIKGVMHRACFDEVLEKAWKFGDL